MTLPLRVPVRLLAATLLLLLLAPPRPAAPRLLGFNFLNGQWSSPKYDSASALSSLSALSNGTSSTAVSLSFAWFQRSVDTPGPLYRRAGVTPTDAQLGAAVSRARALGLRAVVRPLVDPDWSVANNTGTWRGQIGRRFTPDEWDRWFGSYTAMLVRYASLARSWGADRLCVGAELEVAARSQPARWRAAAAAAREAFGGGPLLYSANWGNEGAVAWWDAVDEIGVDAYYPLAPAAANPSAAQLAAAWAPVVRGLGALSARWGGRPVVLTEIGYCGVSGTNRDPAHCGGGGGPFNGTAQAAAYGAALAAFWDEPWFGGALWWAWNTGVEGGGAGSTGFSPRWNPETLAVVRRYFTAAPRP